MYSDRNPPKRCPNGHQLGPRRVLVGWSAVHDPPCRTWRCRKCDAIIYERTATWYPKKHLDGLHYVPKSSES